MALNLVKDILHNENILQGLLTIFTIVTILLLYLKSELSNKYVYIKVFIAALLPRVFLCLMAVPLKTYSDELASICVAPYLAGYNWSAVISHAGYYGGGFYALFAPLFSFTDNPYILYRIILIGGAIVEALVAPISYYMMKEYFDVKNKVVLNMGALACSYIMIARCVIAYNEHVLTLLIWLIALVLLELIEAGLNKKKKNIYTLILMLLMGYALTIHTRMLSLWIAVALLVIVYYMFYRKWIVSKACVLFGGGLSYIIAKRLVNNIQNLLWNAADNGGELRNGSISLNIDISFASLRTWKAWLSIIAGQLETINMVTGGIATLCIVGIVMTLWKLVISKWHKKEDNTFDKNFFVIAFYFCCCAGMTILAQSITWLPGASYGISHGKNSHDYGLKAFTYLRYFGVYIGPLFMLAFVSLEKRWEEWSKHIYKAAVFSIGLLMFWCVIIMPFIYTYGTTASYFYPFSWHQWGTATTLRDYIAGIAALVISMILLYRWISKKKLRYVLLYLCFFLSFQYIGDCIRGGLVWHWRNEQFVDAGYQCVKTLEDNGIVLPKQMYFLDGRGKQDHQIYYGYQFYLNRYEILPAVAGEEESILKDKIVFSNMKKNQKLLEKGYTMIQLDNNEFVYATDEWVDIFINYKERLDNE